MKKDDLIKNLICNTVIAFVLLLALIGGIGVLANKELLTAGRGVMITKIACVCVSFGAAYFTAKGTRSQKAIASVAASVILFFAMVLIRIIFAKQTAFEMGWYGWSFLGVSLMAGGIASVKKRRRK